MDNLILRKNGQQGELKGTTQKLSELGLIDGDLIRLEIGQPHQEDMFELNVCLVQLASTNDECLFNKEFLFNFKIAPTGNTGLSFKQQVLSNYNTYSGKSL